MITAALSRAAERTVPAIPGMLDGPLSELAGTAAYLASPRARAAVHSNLAVIAPGRPQRARLTRRVFVEQARHYLETFRLLRLDHRELLRIVEIHGWPSLAAAHARGRGVVLTSAHLGPVVLCGQIVAARGLDVSVLVEPKHGDLGRVIDRARGALGVRTIETGSAMGVVRALRRGGVVGFLADRAMGGSGERVPFFGREALLPSGHVAIALRTGAALVPGFAVRDGGRIHAFIEPEIGLPRTADRAADVREGVRRWAAALEPWVRRAPEQWSVFEPVWR
ncbi:MAG: lysophospholipid acyltransferase family protein [Candidatus Limnocylindria bacterium]